MPESRSVRGMNVRHSLARPCRGRTAITARRSMCYNRAMPATHAAAFPLTACPLSWRPSRAHIKNTHKTVRSTDILPSGFSRSRFLGLSCSPCSRPVAGTSCSVRRTHAAYVVHSRWRPQSGSYIHTPPAAVVICCNKASCMYAIYQTPSGASKCATDKFHPDICPRTPTPTGPGSHVGDRSLWVLAVRAFQFGQKKKFRFGNLINLPLVH